MAHRILAVLVASLVVWLTVVAVLFVWPPSETGPPAHADVVVVLSGGLNWRLNPALELMRHRIAPVLAISSPATDPHWLKAHRLCAGAYRTRFRVLCFQARPYSTRGEAETVARLARAYGWHRIVVVSSTYHLTRARMLFGRCFHGHLWMVGSAWPLSIIGREWIFETGKLLVQRFFERGC